jgi:hypothetical protein
MRRRASLFWWPPALSPALSFSKELKVDKKLLIQIETQNEFILEFPEVAVVSVNSGLIKLIKHGQDLLAADDDLLSVTFHRVPARIELLSKTPEYKPWDTLCEYKYDTLNANAWPNPMVDYVHYMHLIVYEETFCFEASCNKAGIVQTYEVVVEHLIEEFS